MLLSERYITDRFLPDKAIDLIDEACSDMNLKDEKINRRMEIEKELADYEKEKELLVEDTSEESYARQAEIKSREIQLGGELDTCLLYTSQWEIHAGQAVQRGVSSQWWQNVGRTV